MENVTRRGFVAAAGAAAVAGAAATRLARAEEGTGGAVGERAADREVSCDIVIIGAGAAGLAACVEAAERGLATVCIESQDTTGGNEDFVEGCFAVGSRMQKEEGLEYSTGALIRQELEQAQYRVCGLYYNDMVHSSGENLDWLLDHDVQFGGVDADLGTDRVFHRFATGNGAESYVPQMTAAAEAAGCQFMLGAHADALVVEDGRVCGVWVTDADGASVKVGAAAVVIATGGFMNNVDYMAQAGFRPENTDYVGKPGHDGAGHDMAVEAGGASNLSNSGSCGALKVPGLPTKFQGGKFFYLCLSVPDAIWVNQDGERFVNEDCAASNFCLMQNPFAFNEKTFVLLDEEKMNAFIAGDAAAQGVDAAKAAAEQNGNSGSDAGFAELDMGLESGIIAKAETFEELAEKTGMDSATLAATVERYNQCASEGVDEDYGKNASCLSAFGEGPYYAARVVNEVLCMVGSVKTNRDFAVVDAQGAPIPGLYAAGVEGAMLWANVYTINISGACNANSVNSGRGAVRHAAEEYIPLLV